MKFRELASRGNIAQLVGGSCPEAGLTQSSLLDYVATDLLTTKEGQLKSDNIHTHPPPIKSEETPFLPFLTSLKYIPR